jgi:hypothetical protein
MYRDNTPTFNVNRKVIKFKDFLDNEPSEIEELNKIKRQTKPNSKEGQQLIGNNKTKYNKVSNKLDTNLDPKIIDDKIKAFKESNIFDDDVYLKLSKSPHYRTLVNNIRSAINEFEENCLDIYDYNDNDQEAAFKAVLQDALDQSIEQI